MAEQPRYTVTVNIAAPGTALLDGKTGQPTGETSLPGHMWYSISDGPNGNADRSYGFSPIKSEMSGPGQIKDDEKLYAEKYYSRTMEVTKDQYDKLREFGEAGVNRSEEHFNLQYGAAANSCVDFVYQGLRHAGIKPSINLSDSGRNIIDKVTGNYDGKVLPNENMRDIKTIKAPFPNSDLNQEIKNDQPTKQWFKEPLKAGAQKFLFSSLNPDVQDIYNKLDSGLGEKIEKAGAGKFSESMLSATALACVENGLPADKIDRMGINTQTNTIFASDQWGTKMATVDAFAAAKVNPQETLQQASQLQDDLSQQHQERSMQMVQQQEQKERAGPSFA